MVDKLDRLKKLQELRASGALSESEFEGQKEAVLRSPSGLPSKVLGGLAALFLLIAGTLIWFMTRSDNQSLAQPASAPSPATAELTVPTTAAPVQAEASALAQAVTPEMLGGRLAYFNTIAGEARERFGQTSIYVVKGCELSVTTDTAGSVFSIEFSPSKNCDVDLTRFFSTNYGMASNLKIGTLAKFGGSVRSDCISSCGNAADPTVQFTTGGSRADNYRTITATVTLDDDASFAASTTWENAMQRQGEDYILETRFNCDSTYHDVAKRAFKALSADRVMLAAGYPDTESDGCGSGD